jgi:hypothetical protein
MGLFILHLSSMTDGTADGDLTEMENLLKAYLEKNTGGLPETRHELYEFDYKDLSAGYARLMGRDVHNILEDHPAVVQKIKDMAIAHLGHNSAGLKNSSKDENILEETDDDEEVEEVEDYVNDEDDDVTDDPEIFREILLQFIKGLDEWSEFEMPQETEELPLGLDTDMDEEDYVVIPEPRHFSDSPELDVALFLQHSAAKLYQLEQQVLRHALAVLDGQQFQIVYAQRPNDTLYDSTARCIRDGVKLELSANENDEGLVMSVILSSEIQGYPYRIELFMTEYEPQFKVMPRRLVSAFRQSFREESSAAFRADKGEEKAPALSFEQIQGALEKSAEEYISRLLEKNRGSKTVAWYERHEQCSYCYFIHESNSRMSAGIRKNEEFYINFNGNRQKDEFSIEFTLRPGSPVIDLIPQTVMTAIMKSFDDKTGGKGMDVTV